MSDDISELEYIDCINITKTSNSSNKSTNFTTSSNNSSNNSSSKSNFHGGSSSSECNSNTSTNSTHSTQTELDSLIRILKKGIKDNEPGIKVIKHPLLLIESLEELNNLIGLYRLKESVALQTIRLIENLRNGEKSLKMLNTVLTGSPGCGKTECGLILGKIWFALGFLSQTTVKTTVTSSAPGSENIGGLLLLLIAIAGTYIISAISFVYSKVGFFWLAFILGLIILFIIMIYYNKDNIDWKSYTTVEETSKSDREIVSVVSRNDFVAEYLGQTSGKTKKLLEANIGGVLFIDEAYSLLNDPRDAYGYEALNTLNMFLSENADKIVVIFAGYKEHMKNSIFMAQPGLERRCMWQFDCEKYSSSELADIFFLQVKKDGWSIFENDVERIRKLIARNEHAFKNQGGDCARLLYLSTIEVSRSGLSVSASFLSSNYSKNNSKILKYSHVEKGIITLKENQC